MSIEQTFWDQIKQLADADTSVMVPASVMQQAVALFDQDRFRSQARIFQLLPTLAADVRKAGATEKVFYELDEAHVVQLELTHRDSGIYVDGFADGLDSGQVYVYGNECSYQTQLEAGSFRFESLPQGIYQLQIQSEGEDYWITGLQLNGGLES